MKDESDGGSEMIGSRNTGQDGLAPMADINVTSLVDVAFTLLIIFIIKILFLKLTIIIL